MNNMFDQAAAFNQDISSWNPNPTSSCGFSVARGATAWLGASGGTNVASTPPLRNAVMAALCGL